MVLVRVVPSESGDEPARVDVLGSYDIKDALKAQHYRWSPENKAWWTPLQDDTLSKLKELAEREGVTVTGLDAALRASGRGAGGGALATPGKSAAPRRAPPGSPASPDARSAGGAARHTPQRALGAALSPYARTCTLTVDAKAATTVATGKTFDVKTALQDLSFTYTSEPTPRWTLERAADAALLSTLQDAAKESGVELRIVRAGEKAARKKAQSPPAPRAPTCDVHGVPCVLCKCGPNAKPHNRGRRFWCCPRATPETEDCFWEWEDGTKPFGEESQARFDKWLDSQGGCGICDAMGFLGMACNCDYDYDDE